MSAQGWARDALGGSRVRRPRHGTLRLLLLISAVVVAGTLASASVARAASKLPCELDIKGIPACSTTVSLSGAQLRSTIYVTLAAPPLEMSLPGEAEPWGLPRLLELQLAERLENEEPLSTLSPAVNKEIHHAFEEIAAALKATEPAEGKQEISALQGEVLVALDTVSTKLNELLKQAKAKGESSAEETLALMSQASREQDKAALREVAGEQFLPNWSSEKNTVQPEEILSAAFTDAEADTSFEALAELILGPGPLPPLNSSIKKLEQDLKEQGEKQEAAAAAAGDPSSSDAYTALQDREGSSAGTSNPVAQISLGQTYSQVATAGHGVSQGFQTLAAGLHTWVQNPTGPSLTKFQQSISGAGEYLHLQSAVSTFAISAARFFYSLSNSYQAALRGMNNANSFPLYGAFVEAQQIAVKDVAGNINKFALLIDPITAISMISELPNIIMSIINLIAHVPSFEEIQLEQDKQIEEMIKSVSQEIEAGFAEVDAKLDGVAVSLERDTELLEHVGSNISRLRNEMSRLQDSLTELREDIFNIASTQREEGFQVALNTDLGYSTRTPGGVALPVDQFEQAAGLFYTWATEDPFNYLSENPAKHDLDEAAKVLNSSCPELGPQNPLNCNLDFFASIIGSDNWGPSISTRLPNPEVWAAGASAYAQLLLENPEYVTKPVLTRLQQVESVGEQLPPIPTGTSEPVTWLGELTTQGPPNVGNGYINGFPPISTGSSVLNNALLNYELRFAGLSVGRPSLTQRLEGSESAFLSQENQGEKEDPAYCKPCRLAEAPESEAQSGNVLIEPWSAEASEEHATCQEGVTKYCIAALRAESLEAPGYSNVQGQMNECGYDNAHKLSLEGTKEVNALTDPLEPYFALAWQLGLGKVLICWSHEGDEQANPYSYKSTDLLLKWYWQPTGGSPTEILKLELGIVLYSPESGECSTGTEEKYYENLVESWGVKGGSCYTEPHSTSDLEEQAEQVMQKEIAGRDGKLLTGPAPPKTCTQYMAEIASGNTTWRTLPWQTLLPSLCRAGGKS